MIFLNQDKCSILRKKSDIVFYNNYIIILNGLMSFQRLNPIKHKKGVQKLSISKGHSKLSAVDINKILFLTRKKKQLRIMTEKSEIFSFLSSK